MGNKISALIKHFMNFYVNTDIFALSICLNKRANIEMCKVNANGYSSAFCMKFVKLCVIVDSTF